MNDELIEKTLQEFEIYNVQGFYIKSNQDLKKGDTDE